MPLLEIKNLHVEIDGKKILNGLDLTVNPGEVHAIMGPNGSGKSTLAYVLAGKDDYEVTAGEVLYNGENVLEMDPDARAAKGVFLAFQYPIEIPGVANAEFLKAALNAIRAHRGLEELDAIAHSETNMVYNTGGGAKITLLGPLRVRLDYRLLKLQGDTVRPDTVHRLYAGINLAF